MSKIFRVEPLGSITHTIETKEVLAKVKPWSRSVFIRESIVILAKNLGFDNNVSLIDRPDYITPDEWQEISKLRSKSRTVDYNFLIAFYWLKREVEQFRHIQNSDLIRKALLEFQITSSA